MEIPVPALDRTPIQGDSGTTGFVENRQCNEEALSAFGVVNVHSSLTGEIEGGGDCFDVEEGYKYIFSDDSSIVPPRGSVFACDESADQTNIFSDEIFLPRKVSGGPLKHKPFLTPKQDPKSSSVNTETLKISIAVDIRTGQNIDVIEIDSDNLLSAEELLDDDDDIDEEVKHGMRDPGTSSTGVEDGDSNDDVCFVCYEGGDLICCDECPRSYHLQCYVEQYYDGDPDMKKEIDEESQFACKECDEFVDDEDYDDDEMESCMVNDWKQLWGPGGLMRHLTDSRLNQGRTGSAPLPEEMLNSQEITEDFDSQKGSAIGWKKFVDAPVEKFEQITREIEQNQKDRPEMYHLGLSKISIAKREREVMESYVKKEKAAKAAAKAQRNDVAAQSNVREHTVDLVLPSAKRQKLDSNGKSRITPWLAQAAELNRTVKNTQNQNNFESQTKISFYPIVVNTTSVGAPANMNPDRSKEFHPKGDSNAKIRESDHHTHGGFELLDHENQDARANADRSGIKVEALNLKYANDGIYGPPLICAVKRGNLEDVKHFVHHGIDPATIISNRGDTVLHHVGVSKVLQYLLQNCSSLENIIDQPNYSNDTPLMVAVRNNCVETVKVLVKTAHCDSGIKGGDGCSPLSIAKLNRNHEIALLLKQDGGASVYPVQPHLNSAVENFEHTNEVEVRNKTHTNCRACGKKQAGQQDWLDQNKEFQILCVDCYNTIRSLENPPLRGRSANRRTYCIL